MSLYQKFLDGQKQLERTHADFLGSLDPRRTATLSELLTDDAAINRLGLSGSVVRALLRQRIVAYADFMNRLPAAPISGGSKRLIFFQSSIKREEATPDPRPMFAHVPRLVRYLHTVTDFSFETTGTWIPHSRIIKPGYSFSNDGWRGLYPNNPGRPIKSGLVVGYRLPRYTDLLGVSPQVATDYLARIVTHDLGHAVLPHVHGDREPLHDVAMVYAMDAGAQKYEKGFAGIVHRECTDPFFFLDAPDFLEALSEQGLSAAQRFYLNTLRQKYDEDELRRVWAPIWGLCKEIKEEDCRNHIRGVIHEMRMSGFARYQEAA